MNRQILLPLLLATVFAAPAGAQETTVYRTKNADGTTTYSQTDSEGAEARVVHSSGASTRVEKPAPATAAPDEMDAADSGLAAAKQAACDNAIANLAVFDSGEPVGRETAEGEAVPLSAEETAAARAAAQRQKDANCAPVADP